MGGRVGGRWQGCMSGRRGGPVLKGRVGLETLRLRAAVLPVAACPWPTQAAVSPCVCAS